jgi:hypothetical protein
MAKKRREKTEEEELDFKLPKFDEEKFLKKERRNIKTLFISFILGSVLSLVSFGFWALLTGSEIRWYLVLLVGIFGAPWLKYVYINLNIDLTDFGRKGWFGSYATYFFTWLIIIILLVNPPFYDEESPIIEIVTLPGMQEMGGTVDIVAYILDNVEVNEESLDFTLVYPDGTSYSPDFIFNNNIFRYSYENTENISGEYTFTLIAEDVNGHETKINDTFEYNEDALKIISSLFSDIRSGDIISIKADQKISSENFRVYYVLDNDEEINVDRADINDEEKYETTAEYQGWSENSNVTMTLFAEVSYFFVNINENFTNVVRDNTEYEFSTGFDSSIGTEPPLEINELNYNLPYPRGLPSTPGFEIIAFMVSLIAVVFILKSKKKKKK